ncbi:hypothetical protein GCM10028818_57180 [Spirosoma horti]
MTYLNPIHRLIWGFSVLFGLLACQHKDPVATTVTPVNPQPTSQPYPASDHASLQPIYGTYQASSFNDLSSPVAYPINGQTVSLALKPFAGDTVQVSIQATANGKYSPGKDLTYARAVVVSKIHTDGTVIYYVYLTQPTPTDCGYNTLYIYPNTSMDYNFIPPGNSPCLGARIRFSKQ